MKVSRCRSTTSDSYVSRSASSEHPSNLAVVASTDRPLVRARLPSSCDLRPIVIGERFGYPAPDSQRKIETWPAGPPPGELGEQPGGGKGGTFGMELPRVSAFTGARGRGVCLRVV